jgi:HSP20 family molecular chaperone IbpA
MFGFLKKIFKNTSDSEISASGDYNFDQIDENKSNLYSNKEIYYIHTEPDSVDRGHMESTSTIIMNPNMTVYDHVTGREIPMDQVSMEQISPGINIPGIGVVEPKHKRTNNQRTSNNGTQNIDIDNSSGTSISVNEDVKYPPTEIIVTGDAYHVYIDLAGVKKTDVKLTFTDNALTVSGKRNSMIEEWKQMSKGKGRKHTVVNSTSSVPPAFLGQFTYKYPFKKSVDESMIEAKFFDGLLHVTLPLRAKSDAISIAII